MNKNHISDDVKRLNKLSQAAPLLALIATERSFSKAAEKLGVLQSAVSHRVSQLEEALGLALFERTTRQLRLTPYGEILCEAATRSMESWVQALARIDAFQSTQTIRLSLSSSLAMKWMLPILPRALENGVEIALDVNDQPVSFETTGVDAAIRFGMGPFAGLHSSLLQKAQLIPVASPSYMPEGVDVQAFVSRGEAVFLKDATGEKDETGFNWQTYQAQSGIALREEAPSLSFNRADLVLQAAVNGMGLALGRTLLVEADIAQGFLKPIGPAVEMKAGYWLVCKPSFAQTERYARLKAWLLKELKV